jgi:hypothetical protein
VIELIWPANYDGVTRANLGCFTCLYICVGKYIDFIHKTFRADDSSPPCIAYTRIGSGDECFVETFAFWCQQSTKNLIELSLDYLALQESIAVFQQLKALE